MCFQIFVPRTSDVLQDHAGPLLISSPRAGTGDIPITPTISRQVSVILMKWPEGSLHLERCQITYHPSYLKKGRTSITARRPLPSATHHLSSMPRILSPESHSVLGVMHIPSHIIISRAWSHHNEKHV